MDPVPGVGCLFPQLRRDPGRGEKLERLVGQQGGGDSVDVDVVGMLVRN